MRHERILFQFKNGRLAWVRGTQLAEALAGGVRFDIAYDYSLGRDVWYQL